MRKTIWHPGALDNVQKRFRWIFQIGLPAFDVVLIAFGIFGAVVGSKIILDITFEGYNLFWSISIGITALLALVGLIFWFSWLEILAKIWLLVSLGVYGILAFVRLGPGNYTSTLTICLTVIAVGILIGRIADLVGVIARKEGPAHS